MQEHMRVLTQDMGVHPDAGAVAHRLWSARLASCGILEPDFAM